MKLFKILRRLAAAFGLLLLACAFALWLRPPDLLRVGANYSAKIVCSNVFLAARDPDEVLRTDVQAPGVGLLRLMRVSVDRERRVVRAGLLGFIGDGLAIERPGNGCTAVPDGNLSVARRVRWGAAPGDRTPAAVAPGSADAAADWPIGNAVATDAALDRLLADDTLAGPGVRAIVVVHHGRIVAERYAAGFSAATPLLGWSMTKSVVAGLVGVLVKEGRLALDQSAGWPAVSGAGRERIRIADLLAMSSGLRFNEAYGAVSMSPHAYWSDMAGFARAAIGAPREFWSIRAGRPTSCHASCKTRRAGSAQSIRPKSSSGRSA